jgi:ribosomal protein S18 acetylase RimI-like enzyme
VIELCIADLSNPDHSAALVSLLNDYANDPMGGHAALAPAVKQHLVAELAKRPWVRTVLAFVDGAPAGLAITMEGFSTFACKPLLNIHDLAVSPAYRGRGLSTQLLAQVEILARELGCCKITLEVLEGNKPAQASYRSFGFAGYELEPAMGKAMFWQKSL